MFKNWVLCLFVAISCMTLSIEGAGAMFEFQIEPFPEKYVFALTDDAYIQQARDILSGKEVKNTHVLGEVVRIQPQDSASRFNPEYDFFLLPNTIDFFDSANTGIRDNFKCDVSIKDIQNCQNNCTYFDFGSKFCL